MGGQVNQALISVEGLKVSYHPKHGLDKDLVHPLSLEVFPGEIVGIVGESGSGKSLTMKALMGLLPDRLTMQAERYDFDGQAVKAPKALPFSMIFQDPMTSLDPVVSIGDQLKEVIDRFQNLRGKEAEKVAIKALDEVGIPRSEEVIHQYAHELSGGMRQRVMIAMALLTKSRVLIADEPTTALDVTIQTQILKLILRLQEEQALTVILVTHDFGVVAGMCDRIYVMLKGRMVEEGTTENIFYNPKDPYTKRLLKAAKLDGGEGEDEVSR